MSQSLGNSLTDSKKLNQYYEYNVNNEIQNLVLIVSIIYVYEHKFHNLAIHEIPTNKYQFAKAVQTKPMLNFLKTKLSIPTSSPTEREHNNQLPPIVPIDKQQISHIILCVLCILLILFTLSASIALLVVSVVNSEISQAKGLTGFLMFMAVLISLIAVAAIIMSWKKLKWYLKIYQYTCLIALVLLIIILIGIALMNLNRYSDSGQASRVLNDCNSPRSYFEYQMLDITTSAANMLCSPTCPCPQSTKIQQCSQWKQTTYDTIMSYMQIKFNCSGWCEVNENINFIFSGIKQNILSINPCYNQWNKWINSQWKSINGCIATIVAILFCNVIAGNWRIVTLQKDDQ